MVFLYLFDQLIHIVCEILHFKITFCIQFYSCDGEAELSEAITPVFSVTWSSKNHSNMPICCSGNIYCYQKCWKLVVLLNDFVDAFFSGLFGVIRRNIVFCSFFLLNKAFKFLKTYWPQKCTIYNKSLKNLKFIILFSSSLDSSVKKVCI